MARKVDEAKCVGCGACAGVCPAEAIAVDGVAATAIVEERAVRAHHVVILTLEALERKDVALRAAFRRVIEYNVKINFQPRAMKRLNHFLKLRDLRSRRRVPCVSSMRRAEGDRIVTPVVSAFFPLA